MKLGVIGEPCIDYIYRGSISHEKQFGGILYSVVSLAVISGKSAGIYPLMNLGEDEYESVAAFLNKFRNIKTDFINKSQHKTRVVNLYYKDSSSALNTSTKKIYDREENSTEPTLPVEFKQIKGALENLDGILINMVSGNDITLDTLKKIRENFTGYIHMDLHNLVMKTFPDGTRKQIPVKDWLNWCRMCDTLQMNESEIAILTGDSPPESETAEEILKKSKVKSVVVTRGERGATLYEPKRKEKGGKRFKLDKTDVCLIKNIEFADSTGCGDVFASGFFFKSIEKNLNEFTESLHFANKMAGLNASLKGVEELNKLNDGT